MVRTVRPQHPHPPPGPSVTGRLAVRYPDTRQFVVILLPSTLPGSFNLIYSQPLSNIEKGREIRIALGRVIRIIHFLRDLMTVTQTVEWAVRISSNTNAR